jgi:hypothetical protein
MEQVENRISRTENKVEKLHQVRQRKMLRKLNKTWKSSWISSKEQAYEL